MHAGFGSELALFFQLDLNPSSFLCSFGYVHEPNQSGLCRGVIFSCVDQLLPTGVCVRFVFFSRSRARSSLGSAAMTEIFWSP
jgi:hypothetical protein